MNVFKEVEEALMKISEERGISFMIVGANENDESMFTAASGNKKSLAIALAILLDGKTGNEGDQDIADVINMAKILSNKLEDE